MDTVAGSRNEQGAPRKLVAGSLAGLVGIHKKEPSRVIQRTARGLKFRSLALARQQPDK